MLCSTSIEFTQRSYWFDSSKARNHFGYNARVSIKEGIERITKLSLENTHIVHSTNPDIRVTYE